MLSYIGIVLLCAVIFLSLPAFVLGTELIVGCLSPKSRSAAAPRPPGPPVDVLVPAHDEGAGLIPTLADVQAQLRPTDRLLVVADNCTDDTAAVARAFGARVVERTDPTRVGKGFALDFGLRSLEAGASPVTIIVDADVRLAAGLIDALVEQCLRTGRPAQAVYLMHAPEGSTGFRRIGEFAWLLKNKVRPLGLNRLGFGCQLTGAGMAFPSYILREVHLATGDLVEDLRLGLELAEAGHPPALCPEAALSSTFPTTDEAAARQRQRWEIGSSRILTKLAPALLWRGLVKRDANLMALAVDALVPPTAILIALTGLIWISAAVAFATGLGAAALVSATLAGSAVVIGIGLAWGTFGREVVRGGDFRAIVQYIGRKPAMYRERVRRSLTWVRTDRS